MKVKFKEVMAGQSVVYNTLDVYDIEKDAAKRLINKGICFEYSEAKEEINVVKATVSKKAKVVKKKQQK